MLEKGRLGVSLRYERLEIFKACKLIQGVKLSNVKRENEIVMLSNNLFVDNPQQF